MAMSKSRKPNKPYPAFPLTAHPNGQWCKKVRGKVCFFGVWDDPKTALSNYTEQAADLHAGRKPRPRISSGGPTVKEIGNTYLAAQEEKAKRELITWQYFDWCAIVVKDFVNEVGKERSVSDLRPEDFQAYRLNLYDRFEVHTIERCITVVKSMLKYAYDNDIIDRPVKYGSEFKKPTQKEKRLSRQQSDIDNGKRLFTHTEIRTLIDAAGTQLKAMILLGINGGFGNRDCANLRKELVDLENGLIDYARGKTGKERTIPLWPETLNAIQKALEVRPKPRKPEYDNLVFLTAFGNPWVQEWLNESESETDRVSTRKDALSQEFKKLLQTTKLQRKKRSFYALRHTFRTWADSAKDQHAILRIMGHAIPGMSGVYVEEISTDRLRAVTEHVHGILFAKSKKKQKNKEDRAKEQSKAAS